MTEEEIMQCRIVKYLTELKQQGKIKRFTAIPNSTYTESWTAKTKNIKMGLRKGLPDLFVIGLKSCYFLELKTTKGVLSEHQKEWIKDLNETGLPAYVVYGYEDSIALINSLL